MLKDSSHAYRSITARFEEFLEKGWDRVDLLCCAMTRNGHHGLLFSIRQGWEIGRIAPWCCELITKASGSGKRAMQTYFRTGPLHQIMHRHGLALDAVYPPEFRRPVQ